MWCKNLLICVSLVAFPFSGSSGLADCPSADLTGYDLQHLTEMADQWLTTDPCVPDDMTYIPDGEFEMGNHHGDGHFDELPLKVMIEF